MLIKEIVKTLSLAISSFLPLFLPIFNTIVDSIGSLFDFINNIKTGIFVYFFANLLTIFIIYLISKSLFICIKKHLLFK